MNMNNKCHNNTMHEKCETFSLPTKQTSMCSLIIWNISKALGKNPNMDLREALRSALDRAEREPSESNIISEPPEYRHLMCALLAWQQLGHKDADGLYQFVVENQNKSVCGISENSSVIDNINTVNKAGAFVKPQRSVDHKHSQYSKSIESNSFDTYSLMGPVVKLPVETKIVMHMENTCARHNAKKIQKDNNDIMKKIDSVCCKDSVCVQRLTELDKSVSELRTRAARLAKREADRVELLERAEAAWKDLERSYQRRLGLSEEKEDDMIKQIQKLVDERNEYKTVCMNMAQTLKERGDNAQNDRVRLTEIEKDMCDRACVRLRLSEESARGDTTLSEQLCRLSQLDRDLQFKEEQARRKVLSLESEIDSERCLTYESERAMRAELSALKEQISQVSQQLIDEDNENNIIKAELESLRKEKSDMIEDLDGCKVMCDSRMQSRVDELKQKREQLNELKEKVMECKCKVPQDVTVEVKRTPSLAALCYCSPEDKYLESCSCTSLRSQLLSNLLADLFGGLQSELGGSGSLMSCQLLKCLEDRHNWDRASIIKTNLLKFFAQLLMGELDIAIATSIEKYHAKWVGACCADQCRTIPDLGDISNNEDWQARAIERRAQKLASQLAEQLFKERADQLTKKAKEIVSHGPPPCECKPQSPAVFPVLVKQQTLNSSRKTNDAAPSYLKRTMQDVTHLRAQIEDLKKESIKKEDLRKMEKKITKIVGIFSKPDKISSTNKHIKLTKEIHDEPNNKLKIVENISSNLNTTDFYKKRGPENYRLKKNMKSLLNNQRGRVEKHSSKLFRKIEQSFAVNLCLCDKQNKINKQEIGKLGERPLKIKKEKIIPQTDIVPKTSTIKQSKPISLLSSKEQNFSEESKASVQPLCPSDCVCFHKIPSNTSIDKLLETLTKWKADLGQISSHNGENKNDDVINTQIVNSGSLQKINITDSNSVSRPSDNEKNKYCNSSNPIEKLSSEDVNNKFTSYEIALPPATESEYIGAVNLDKSYDNSCKCNRNAEIIQDSIVATKPIRFQCLNIDSCKCKKSVPVNPSEIKPNNAKKSCNLKNESQIYSVEQETNYLSIDKKTDITQTSVEGVEAGADSVIKDIVNKSDLFPCNCDYRVKFLGVTLGNIKADKKTRENYDTDKLPSNYKDGTTINHLNRDASLLTNIKKDVNYDLQCGLNSCEYGKQLLSTLNYTQDKKSASLVIPEKTDEGECVCCGNIDKSELEVNVYNLLEEHLKGKLSEFQHSLSKSACLPPDEEKHLFSTILNKVKKVISESTGNLTCKCVQEKNSEGSWSRVYGLLQEYLKIKIKRVQCSCVSGNKGAELILPGVMEKVNNLIEQDFQRLREKYGSQIKNDNSSFAFKHNQVTRGVQDHQDKNETYVQFDVRDTNYLKDTSLQSPNIIFCDKSCETIDKKLFDVNTSEKKVSCELNRVYGTFCDCRFMVNEYSPFHKDAIVNQRTDLIPIKDKKFNDAPISIAGISSTNFSSLKSSTTPREKKEVNESPEHVKHPYIGYTLNCSCDRTLGNCHCSKSTVETNSNKIDFIWKTLTTDLYPKKISYIMPKIVTNVRSEHIVANKSNFHCNSVNDFQYDNVNKHVKLCYDTEISTSFKDDILLKDSNDKFTGEQKEACTSENNNTKTDQNHELIWSDCDQQSLHSNKQSTDTTYENKIFNDSIHLSTDNCSKNQFDSNSNLDPEPEKCDCKMVPICHVKMLVDDIEKRIINSNRTCDALLPEFCPVHFKQQYY